MSAIVIRVAKALDGTVTWMFWCVPCDTIHAVNSTWSLGGTLEKPTIQPSVLVHGRNYDVSPPEPRPCHSFVTDGKIQYLGDCWHDLRGQTVDLLPCERWRFGGTE